MLVTVLLEVSILLVRSIVAKCFPSSEFMSALSNDPRKPQSWLHYIAMQILSFKKIFGSLSGSPGLSQWVIRVNTCDLVAMLY